MNDDDILREVRSAREAYAQLHNFDVRAMVADLKRRDAADDWPVVSRPPRRLQPAPAPLAAHSEQLQQQ